MSDERPQQGDPLGPLLFCLTVMAFVKQVKSQCNIWYMDDGAIGDNVDALLSDIRMLMDESRKLDLVAKCEIITDNDEVGYCRSSETSRRISNTSRQQQQCCLVHQLAVNRAWTTY